MMRFILLCACVALCSAQYFYNPPSFQQPEEYFTIDVDKSNTGHNTNANANANANTNANTNANANKLTQQFHSNPTHEEYNKEFYTFTAPSQLNDDRQIDQYISSLLKKNLRVIFIKNPEQNAFENAALKLAQSNLADRTAIYVLNKQPDLNNLFNQLHRAKGQHKPEVHFVNYQTPKDAEHAEQTIKTKYGQLPGTTTFHNSKASEWKYASSSASSTPRESTVELDLANRINESSVHNKVQDVYGPPPDSYLPPSRH